MATNKSESKFFKENEGGSKTKEQLKKEVEQLREENQRLREELINLRDQLNIHIETYNATHCVATYD